MCAAKILYRSLRLIYCVFLGDPENLMFEYFIKFGDKPCCFTDLKVFVDILNPAQHSNVSIVLTISTIYIKVRYISYILACSDNNEKYAASVKYILNCLGHANNTLH